MNEEVQHDEDDTAALDGDVDTEVEQRYDVPLTWSRGQAVLHPARDQLLETVAAMRDDGFVMCIDVTAVDYLEHQDREVPPQITPQRFELVVGLLSHSTLERLRLRVQVPEDDTTVPSLFDLFPGSEALEREVYDMFGITFDGHPDMTRILMPEDWDGHPLRKDYATGQIPVQFKDAPRPR